MNLLKNQQLIHYLSGLIDEIISQKHFLLIISCLGLEISNKKNYLQTFYSYSSPTDIEDFWKFVQKYQLFQQRRKQPITKPSDSNQQRSNILNLPLIYEKKHRLNVSITINKSITHSDPRYDMTGEKVVEYHRLSSVRLAEFKSIIEYYFDFNQKEKVEKSKFKFFFKIKFSYFK
jgi:hypothetical protein